MKKLYVTISLCLIFLTVLGLVGRIDKIDEERITLKQLYNLQQKILEDNIPEQELDSIYHQYSYDYLNSYYEKNYK